MVEEVMEAREAAVESAMVELKDMMTGEVRDLVRVARDTAVEAARSWSFAGLSPGVLVLGSMIGEAPKTRGKRDKLVIDVVEEAWRL